MITENDSKFSPVPLLGDREIYPTNIASSMGEKTLGVVIRGETRMPRYVEPVVLPEQVFEQANIIGREIINLTEQLHGIVENRDLMEASGISETYIQANYEPFLQAPIIADFLGADAKLDEDGILKIIEINTRPQVLGRYDAVAPLLVGESDANAKINPYLSRIINARLEREDIAVVVSHPQNAFNRHHKLFASQMGLDTVALQDLEVDGYGGVVFDGKKIGVIVKQFNNRNLFNPNITRPEVLDSITRGGVQLINSPLTNILAEKTFFPQLGKLNPNLVDYLPEMVTFRTGENINLNDFSQWWLKTETGGEAELVLQLTKQNLQGWPGKVLSSMVAGDFEKGQELIKGRDNGTSERFRLHLRDLTKSTPEMWVLQKNIVSEPIKIKDDDGIRDFHTTFRLYFVNNRILGEQPNTFVEILAGRTSRVSGAGYTIPVKR